MKSVCARVCDTSDIFQASGLVGLQRLVKTQQEATSSEAQILLNDEQTLCIDLVDCYIIPFDFQAGARVLWANVVSKHLMVTEKAAHVSVSHLCWCVWLLLLDYRTHGL